jgi:hypothetical protein
MQETTRQEEQRAAEAHGDLQKGSSVGGNTFGDRLRLVVERCVGRTAAARALDQQRGRFISFISLICSLEMRL